MAESVSLQKLQITGLQPTNYTQSGANEDCKAMQWNVLQLGVMLTSITPCTRGCKSDTCHTDVLMH